MRVKDLKVRYTKMESDLPSNEEAKVGMLGQTGQRNAMPHSIPSQERAERWILNPGFQLFLLVALGVVYSFVLAVATVHISKGEWKTPALIPVLLSFAFALLKVGDSKQVHCLISLMLLEFLVSATVVVLYSSLK